MISLLLLFSHKVCTNRIVRWPLKDFNRAITSGMMYQENRQWSTSGGPSSRLLSSLLFRGQCACKKWPCTILMGCSPSSQDRGPLCTPSGSTGKIVMVASSSLIRNNRWLIQCLILVVAFAFCNEVLNLS